MSEDKQLRSWATDIIEGIIVQDLEGVEYWFRRLYDIKGSYPKRLTNRIGDVLGKRWRYPEIKERSRKRSRNRTRQLTAEILAA
ncbi:MAG: hypothetical protein ACLQEQ_03640 [Nitrososphaerales archaeon]